MSQMFNALIQHMEKQGLTDTKLFSLKQVFEMMAGARKLERASIEAQFDLIPKKEAIKEINDNVITQIIKGRKPGAQNPIRWVKGSAEEVFGSRPVKNQWTEEAITKENVENALVVLLNRGYKTATVRDIVDVIKQFVPQGFKAGKKLIDYRHMVTKRFLSSEKKLLGKYGSTLNGTTYVFNIA